MAKTTHPSIADFRYSGALDRKQRRAFDLKKFDPAARPFGSGEKTVDRTTTQQLAVELDHLQDLFYADRRYKLLVVLQGTDTAGKDGTIRGVFGEMSALGVRTVAWKAPTDVEKAHDFLWRIHRAVPGNGEVVLFNRSHYEDVLVPTVEGWIDAEETERRYAHINAFERLLTDTGTVILKFLLHISKDEQRARLQERIDDPEKNWKFETGDLTVRKKWNQYQAAYSDAVAATGTEWAPWIVVPADSKTHRNLMVATAAVEAMKALKLRYPPPNPELVGVKVK